jgi:PAS domain S-box-containing protein
VGALPKHASPHAFLAGGGETGARLRSLNWKAHPLGSPQDWPQSLKTIVRVMLDSRDASWGLLFVGISPRRPFDEAYAAFLDLVAGQIASVIGNAQAYEAERERAEALAEIDRAKTAFFSNVSHEFRTPLTLMLGPIEDMAADETLPEAVRARVDLLHRNSLRLLKLVNSLLEFSRIEAGGVQATYVPTDLGRETPDLIVSDVMMPRMDGFALLRALRADPELREVPTILLSARAGEEAVVEGLDAMADDYLVKPFSARELIARVGAQLQLARLRREAVAREHALLTAAPLGFYLIDSDFKIRDMNATARPVFGNSPDLIGSDFAAVMRSRWPSPQAEELIRLFRHTLQTGEPYTTRERTIAPGDGGNARFYEWQITRVPLPDGRYGAVCYFRDISAHVHARMALETADRQKNEFLAMLAHELRNPLAPLRNAGEILARTLPPQSPGLAVVGMLKRQVAQLTRLVDDLLDVSRITQGRVELQRRPIELGNILTQAIETAEPLFEAGRHEVSVLANSRALYIDGDMTRLVQCVVNILTNAAKYTDTGGKIRIETRAEGPDAIVTIADSGVGISTELLPRVFDLFVQGERTLDRSLGGLGIGLSVARRLIEMHGGRLSASSPGLGQGATFEIRLPKLERSHEMDGQTQGVTVVPRRILIVDDNADAANSLALVLGLDGHVTEAVYSATEALSRADSFRPEVILLDIGLPEMDGYQVARRLRERPELAGVRIVALTGYGQSDDVRRAREVGFDDHLTKPVDFNELARALEATT